MLRDYSLVREIGRKADAAITRVTAKYSRLADEDDFTSRLLQAFDDEFDGWSHNGVVWRTELQLDRVLDGPPSIAVEARKVTSRGPGTEEAAFGADIVMTVHIDVPGYQVAKSILVQSKRLEPNRWLDDREWNRLLQQIEQMRKLSEHCFVWMYSEHGIRSFAAPQLQHLERLYPPDQLYATSASSLFTDFVKSARGDDQLSATDRSSLLEMQERLRARNALLLSARSRWRP
jgi:hypothetical protein